ncbi:hypothetical protein ERJ75_000904700 [Trypanosoma vivax]|nr:hypothetical protein ERJ75_000904700 [Trypanosoma vivax]
MATAPAPEKRRARNTARASPLPGIPLPRDRPSKATAPAPRRLPSACALGRKRKSSSTSAVTAGERRARCGDGSPTPAAQSLRGTHRLQNLPRTTAQADNARQRRRSARRSAGPTALHGLPGQARPSAAAASAHSRRAPTLDVQCKENASTPSVPSKASPCTPKSPQRVDQPPRGKTARPTRRAGSSGSNPGPGAETPRARANDRPGKMQSEKTQRLAAPHQSKPFASRRENEQTQHKATKSFEEADTAATRRCRAARRAKLAKKKLRTLAARRHTKATVGGKVIASASGGKAMFTSSKTRASLLQLLSREE